MKQILLLLFVILPLAVNASDIRVETAKPTGFQSVMTEFGSDILISANEPVGPMSGIRGANGTMYLAVNDTLTTSNLGLIIFQSTNDGNSWTLFPSGITVRTVYPRIKMIASGDSTLCFLLFGTNIYRWNINSGTIAQFTLYEATDFDVVSSSTNSIYLYALTTTAQLRRFGSTDYGITWGGNTGLVSSSVDRPRLAMSGTGDTLVVNYRASLQTPIENSLVRSFRYRETAPGTLASTGSAIEVVSAGTFKSEYKSVFNGNVMWFIYTEGMTGAIDLYLKVSTNNGAAFGSATPIANNPGRDEYWFDALLGTGGAFTGADIFYYSDSLQAGPPTNQSDNMRYTGLNILNPGTVNSSTVISEHPPVWSSSGYSPAAIEIPGASDVGVAWVGLDATSRRIYWDRYSYITNISDPGITPEQYSLSQNFPNPFNPVTKISFSIPKEGIVTLKVFDMLGREVATLVNGKISAGSYSIDFDAARLSSGAYFYKLESNGFSDVKKMMVVK